MDNTAGKRRATTDLNHDNWDREMEPEIKGTFQTAPDDELKNRVIRKARRKLAGASATPSDSGEGQPTKSVFSGFAGFGKTSSTSSTATFSSISTTDSAKSSNLDKKSDEIKSNTFSFLSKFSTPAKADSETDAAKVTEETCVDLVDSTDNNYSFSKSNTYFAKLKGLNQAVSSWIKTHVDKNPLCLLSPIFKDYEKYLVEIEKDEGSRPITKSKTPPPASSGFRFSATPVPSSTFSFGIKTDSTDAGPPKTSISVNSTPQSNDNSKITTTSFTFGVPKTDSTKTTSTSGFTASSNTGFSFSGSKPFTFANCVPPTAVEPSTDKGSGDEDDEPPKVEFETVVEEDSVYSLRCKVFVMSDGTYSDRGVGTLYLKPVKDSEKTQLLVRADTNLGNILINLILNDSIPTQRMGKNNVMLVCIPNPETVKPTTVLLRVKSSEEADTLLETINKYKK